MSYRHYKTNLDTFHRVEEMYNTTKPMVSKKHSLLDDIRPLGPRNRKWERIKKFSYNCYGLMDGGDYDGLGEHTRQWYDRRTKKPKDIKEEKEFAPILWTYDGTRERIRIRNGLDNCAHTIRYTMLENALPSNMVFYSDNGKQYVGIEHGDGKKYQKDRDYFLPKGDYPLEFERQVSPWDQNLWRVRGNTYKYVHPKKRVDKKRKAEIKPYSDKLLEYVVSMYNILPSTDFDYFNKMTDEIKVHCGHSNWYTLHNQNLSDVICDPEWHRHVTSLFQYEVWQYLRDRQLWGERDNVENKLGGDVDLPTLRARYNDFINKYCQLVSTIEGSAEIITKEETK
jgi:hypothetical protein